MKCFLLLQISLRMFETGKNSLIFNSKIWTKIWNRLIKWFSKKKGDGPHQALGYKKSNAKAKKSLSGGRRRKKQNINFNESKTENFLFHLESNIFSTTFNQSKKWNGNLYGPLDVNFMQEFARRSPPPKKGKIFAADGKFCLAKWNFNCLDRDRSGNANT